jgi:hypothetical protein
VGQATTGQIVEHQGGFPPLTGIAVGADGAIFAASLFTGQVFRLDHGAVTIADVQGPSGLDLSRTGTLYAESVDFGGGPGLARRHLPRGVPRAVGISALGYWFVKTRLRASHGLSPCPRSRIVTRSPTTRM